MLSAMTNILGLLFTQENQTNIFFQRFVVKMWSNQENRVRKQVKNPCEARKIKASQILHKIISTHLLTVLIISVILQLEQRKRDTKRGKKEKDLRYQDSTQVPKKQVNSKWSGSRKHWTKIEKER